MASHPPVRDLYPRDSQNILAKLLVLGLDQEDPVRKRIIQLKPTSSAMTALKIITGILILLVGVFVSLNPNVVYAPTPRVILLFLIAILPGLLFGFEAVSQFEFRLPGFVFTTAGAFAACLGALVVMDHLAKPEEKISVFRIVDSNGESVNLDADSAVDVPVTQNGLVVTKFVNRDAVILIFPEQVGSAELKIKPNGNGPTYTGDVTYAGSRRYKLTLGKDLKTSGSP